jgi:hypothetical protein
MGQLDAAQGNPGADYGEPADQKAFASIWVRKVAQIYTGIDPGNVGMTDLNWIFNKKGIQPVVFHTMKNQALDVYNRGFARAVAGGTAVQQNADSTLVQNPVNATWLGVNDGATVYTVTTGKTLYISGCVVAGANAVIESIKLTNGAGTAFMIGVIGAAGGTYTVPSGVVPITAVSSTDTVKVSGAGAGNNYGSIWGWEE